MGKRRLATFLAVDVVGYSRLMEANASDLLSVLNAIFTTIVRPSVEDAAGRIVKLMGDGALIEFGSAFDALTCAASIQEKMRVSPPPYEYAEPVLLRMGVHAGDIITEGQDIFGDGVNIAKRLETQAEAGGVLLSRTVADLAGGNLPFRLRPEGTRSLKNIATPMETLSIDFADEKEQARRQNKAQSLEIQFCKSTDGQALAWAEVGEGEPIVKAPAFISHLELDWRGPATSHLYDSLSSRRRLVYFDARGNGLSDWDMETVSFDLIVDDLECVFDAAGVERAPIIAMSQGCAIAAAFAARAPERVSAIVMIGGFALGRAKRKSKKDRERAKAMRAMMMAGWDDDYPSLRDLIAEFVVPSASREDRLQYAEDMRAMISPSNMGRYKEVLDNIDVTALIPKVRTPCLVMHCRRDRMHPIEQGRKLAAGIPNARFIAYDSENHDLAENDPCWPLAEHEMHKFLDAHS